MRVADADVISELMRQCPDPAAIHWLWGPLGIKPEIPFAIRKACGETTLDQGWDASARMELNSRGFLILFV